MFNAVVISPVDLRSSLELVPLDYQFVDEKNCEGNRGTRVDTLLITWQFLPDRSWKTPCLRSRSGPIHRGRRDSCSQRRFRKHWAINIQRGGRNIFLLRLIFHRAACTSARETGHDRPGTFSSINSNWCRSIYLSTKRFLRADGPTIFPIIHRASPSPLPPPTLRWSKILVITVMDPREREKSNDISRIRRFLLNLLLRSFLPSLGCWRNSDS